MEMGGGVNGQIQADLFRAATTLMSVLVQQQPGFLQQGVFGQHAEKS